MSTEHDRHSPGPRRPERRLNMNTADGVRRSREMLRNVFTRANELPEPPQPSYEGEIPFHQSARSEANEAVRIITVDQFLYGKRTVREGGPIVKRADHASLAASPNALSISRHDICPNFPSLTPFQRYAWFERSNQIVKMTVDNNGSPFVVICGVGGAKEHPASPRSRINTAMHQISFPAEDWSIAIIPQLAQLLQPRNLPESTRELDALSISTDILDEPLPSNWFVNIRGFLMSIVTGYSVCSEETESTAKEYLQRLFHALICLPESVSRHVSFGAAMWESEGVRINQIQRMPTGRIISKDRASGKWRFPNRNLGDYAQNYVQVIGMLTQECRTPRDVLRVIQSLPQKVVQSVESRFGI